MSEQHYFTSPTGPVQHRPLEVRLAGRDVEVLTADHVFSGERLDLGTRVLLREVPPPPPTGTLLDLGCGWGPIALSMALHAPRAEVWAVDVNDLALELTRRNAERLRLNGIRPARPQDVPDDVRFDAIWSNPPIRVGKAALHELLLTWLPRLREDGVAHLVVQRNLGADSLQAWLAGRLPEVTGRSWQVERAGSAKGYRVLAVRRVPAARPADTPAAPGD